MPDAAEVVSALFILFFGGAMVFLLQASFNDGNVSELSQQISTLAIPVTVFLVVLFFALTIIEKAG